MVRDVNERNLTHHGQKRPQPHDVAGNLQDGRGRGRGKGVRGREREGEGGEGEVDG
jgi:hypothetical protein